jgi:pimeloyl-ACP methyl ester carboxylesterase
MSTTVQSATESVHSASTFLKRSSPSCAVGSRLGRTGGSTGLTPQPPALSPYRRRRSHSASQPSRAIWRTQRSWFEASYPNVIYFHEVDKGGHFAAWEEPELFSSELRAAFRSLR